MQFSSRPIQFSFRASHHLGEGFPLPVWVKGTSSVITLVNFFFMTCPFRVQSSHSTSVSLLCGVKHDYNRFTANIKLMAIILLRTRRPSRLSRILSPIDLGQLHSYPTGSIFFSVLPQFTFVISRYFLSLPAIYHFILSYPIASFLFPPPNFHVLTVFMSMTFVYTTLILSLHHALTRVHFLKVLA